MTLRLEDILYFFGVAMITGVVLGYFLRADTAREDRDEITGLLYENAMLRMNIKMRDAVPHS